MPSTAPFCSCGFWDRPRGAPNKEWAVARVAIGAISAAICFSIVAGCASNKTQIVTQYARPKDMSPAEHNVNVQTCELEGDKAVLQYCKAHSDQCKKKLKESPVLAVRLRA